MTRTFDGRRSSARSRKRSSRPTFAECCLVLGGFALAAIWTGVSAATGAGMEAAGAAWLAALAWAALSSLALALRRGFRDRDWSAFHRYELTDGRDERTDWASKTGRYAYMAIAEENERLMRGD